MDRRAWRFHTPWGCKRGGSGLATKQQQNNRIENTKINPCKYS